MALNIKKAKREDIDFLVDVEMSSGYHKLKFNFKPLLEELFDNETTILCATEKDKIVGYITLGKDGEIAFLAVTKKYQGKGIANKLIEKVISLTKKNKLKRLYLDVRNDNFSAIRIYSKLGFAITELNVKTISGKEIIKLRMEKFLEK